MNILISRDSFYCGDACGRPNDHSDCDLKLALNANLNFITPNEFFDNQTVSIPKIIYPAFNEIKDNLFKNKINFQPQNKEIILMIGYPGSGKSTFVNNILIPMGYIRINRDTLKTVTKCINETKKYLINQKSIVIDNINHNIKSREKYIKLAKSYNYNVRCIIIDVSIELAMHNAMYRFIQNEAPRIPDIVYKVYNKKYEPPSHAEGIKEIVKIKPNFIIYNENYTKLYLY
jgi:bifunctional polynucleotide phosphatase/kinase